MPMNEPLRIAGGIAFGIALLIIALPAILAWAYLERKLCPGKVIFEDIDEEGRPFLSAVAKERDAHLRRRPF